MPIDTMHNIIGFARKIETCKNSNNPDNLLLVFVLTQTEATHKSL